MSFNHFFFFFSYLHRLYVAILVVNLRAFFQFFVSLSQVCFFNTFSVFTFHSPNFPAERLYFLIVGSWLPI